ncbi:MAG: hypothetical protein WC518_03130 [Patescibacteria group bacterium]
MEYRKNIKRKSDVDLDNSEIGGVEMADELAYERGGRSGWFKIIITIVVIIVVVFLGWFVLDRFTSLNLPSFSETSYSSNSWYAVFLSNGQVYFGKVKDTSRETLTLANIYYLQVITKPLQSTQQGETAANQQQTQQELSLFKLGNELHGPTDEMVINRDYVLLTEKLKSDSKVVQAINDYLSKKKTK